MNTVKRTMAALMLAALPFMASAQKIGTRMPVVSTEDDNLDRTYEVFNMELQGVNRYYLTLGPAAPYGKAIAFVDPVTEFFINLGDTLEESIATMESLKGLFDAPKGTELEVQGSYVALQPKLDTQPVKVSYEKGLLTKSLEFRIEKDGEIFAASINKSKFNSLVRSIKIYRKIHPKEK